LNDDITIRPYQEGDEKEIVELLELAFDGWPNFELPCTPLEHWRWKYRDNPQKKIIMSIAESDGRIVSCLHARLFKIRVGKVTILGNQGSDLAVHPDFRGLRITRKLMEDSDEAFKKEGINFEIAFTQRPRKNPRSFPYKATIFARIKNVDLFLESNHLKNTLLKKYGFKTSLLLNRLRNTFSQSKKKSSNLQSVNILEIKDFDERIDTFWNEMKNQNNFIVERNREHLNWRYCDPRGGEYCIKIAEEEGKILGYIILRKKKGKDSTSNDSIGYIIDLLVLPDRADVVDALLSNSIRYFDESKVNLIQTLITENHPYKEAFRKNIFLNSRIEINVFCKSLDSAHKANDLILPETLYVQYGDTDWI
jgi:ribosomal protein S18 acetylase RimI-like enzyme